MKIIPQTCNVLKCNCCYCKQTRKTFPHTTYAARYGRHSLENIGTKFNMELQILALQLLENYRRNKII